jgi:hypothetical protein
MHRVYLVDYAMNRNRNRNLGVEHKPTREYFSPAPVSNNEINLVLVCYCTGSLEGLYSSLPVGCCRKIPTFREENAMEGRTVSPTRGA